MERINEQNVVVGDEILIFGGEIPTRAIVLSLVYNPKTMGEVLDTIDVFMNPTGHGDGCIKRLEKGEEFVTTGHNYKHIIDSLLEVVRGETRRVFIPEEE